MLWKNSARDGSFCKEMTIQVMRWAKAGEEDLRPREKT